MIDRPEIDVIQSAIAALYDFRPLAAEFDIDVLGDVAIATVTSESLGGFVADEIALIRSNGNWRVLPGTIH